MNTRARPERNKASQIFRNSRAKARHSFISLVTIPHPMLAPIPNTFQIPVRTYLHPSALHSLPSLLAHQQSQCTHKINVKWMRKKISTEKAGEKKPGEGMASDREDALFSPHRSRKRKNSRSAQINRSHRGKAPDPENLRTTRGGMKETDETKRELRCSPHIWTRLSINTTTPISRESHRDEKHP